MSFCDRQTHGLVFNKVSMSKLKSFGRILFATVVLTPFSSNSSFAEANSQTNRTERDSRSYDEAWKVLRNLFTPTAPGYFELKRDSIYRNETAESEGAQMPFSAMKLLELSEADPQTPTTAKAKIQIGIPGKLTSLEPVTVRLASTPVEIQNGDYRFQFTFERLDSKTRWFLIGTKHRSVIGDVGIRITNGKISLSYGGLLVQDLTRRTLVRDLVKDSSLVRGTFVTECERTLASLKK